MDHKRALARMLLTRIDTPQVHLAVQCISNSVDRLWKEYPDLCSSGQGSDDAWAGNSSEGMGSELEVDLGKIMEDIFVVPKVRSCCQPCYRCIRIINRG